MRLISQFFLLATSFLLIFIWDKSPLSGYTIQAILLGIIAYGAVTLLVEKRKKKIHIAGSIGIFVLNTASFLVVFATGGFSSPLFFLLYFVSFGIAFALEPVSVFIFSLGAALVFFPSVMTDNVLANSLRLASLILISPLAFLFGRESHKMQPNKPKAKSKKHKKKIIERL